MVSMVGERSKGVEVRPEGLVEGLEVRMPFNIKKLITER